MNRPLRLRWGALAVALGIVGHAAAQTSDPAPGVALELASERAKRVGDLRYELTLRLPAQRSEPVTGHSTIRFRLTSAAAPLVLDFDAEPAQVQSLHANGRALDVKLVNGHLVIPPAALAAGDNELRVAFRAGDAPLNRHDEFLYTLFVPARARQALPCFDQPDLKARWSLTLEHPAAWRSAANGAEAERTPLPGERLRVRFAETAPLPTYLFAFAAGRFEVDTTQLGGRTLRMLHREPDAAKLARNRDAIFELHARALDFLERYTGIEHPFGRDFGFVLIPDLQYGGMEHAGNVFYRADDLLLDPSATQNQLLGRALLIAHEVAHMWFGNLVTMRWFDDVWTKEVFAQFIGAKLVEPSFPAIDHALLFLLQHHAWAYTVDRSAGANPIRQPLANLAEAGSLYGEIVYSKSPVVVRQLEALLGEERFRDGLRAYLKAHRFGNATWADLVGALDPLTPLDLRAWSTAWVERPGRPTIETRLELRDGRIARLALRQRDRQGRGLLWPQPLQVAIGLPDGSVRTFAVALDGAEAELTDAAGLPAPRWVLPAAGGRGYGDFVLDPASLDSLLEQLPQLPDALTRGSAWVTLWESMQEGRLEPPRLLRAAKAALPGETDEQLLSLLLRHAGTLWWRFIGAAERDAQAAAFEALLRAGLEAARTPSAKAAWFNALQRIASTPATLAWLREVWSRRTAIAGLPLAEADEVRLAIELALRDRAGAAALLAAQLERTANADRRERLRFIAPALSADPAERERWFDALRAAPQRRREVWVLDGLQLLHHPLHAADGLRFIEPALRLLPEIQRTGDIFFPKGWLDATLDGHGSRAAAVIVRDFLGRLPADYPSRLRELLLQSSDELFRAAAAAGR